MSVSRLDQLYRRLLLSRFFTKGWGKPENLKRLFAFRKVLGDREQCQHLVASDYPINIDREYDGGDYRVLEGHFVSPFVHHLPGVMPTEVERASFQMILPIQWKHPTYRPVCIQLAGTGDHYYWRRRLLTARPLLKEAGIASILLENPFYGSRKPKDQVRSCLHNVTDLFVMGGALVLESLALLHWCEREGWGPLGISGVSMGGHMASLAATNWSKPIPLVPILSWSTASCVFTQGVMSGAIPWQTLQEQFFENSIYQEEIKKLIVSPEDRWRRAYDMGHKFAKEYSNDIGSLEGLPPQLGERTIMSTPSSHGSATAISKDALRSHTLKTCFDLEENCQLQKPGSRMGSVDIDANVSISSEFLPGGGERNISTYQPFLLVSKDYVVQSSQQQSHLSFQNSGSGGTGSCGNRTVPVHHTVVDSLDTRPGSVMSSGLTPSSLPDTESSFMSSPQTNQVVNDSSSSMSRNTKMVDSTVRSKSLKPQMPTQQSMIRNNAKTKTSQHGQFNIPPPTSIKNNTLTLKHALAKSKLIASKKQPSLPPDEQTLKNLRLEALDFMRGVMDECTHLGNFSVPVDPELIIIVSARQDAYIPKDGVLGLDQLWPGCEVRYIDNGHVGAVVLHQAMFRKAVVDAFKKQAEKYGLTSGDVKS